MHEMKLCIWKTAAETVLQQSFHKRNGLLSYKPAVDDLWHPLSPAHGLPRISVLKINIFIQDQGAPPSP